MNRILQHLDTACRLHHDIKAIRILLLDLLIHGLRIRPTQRHIDIGGIEALGEIDLEPLRRGDDDMTAAILAQHLREHEPRGAGAEHEDRRAHLGCDLVEAVGGAAGGLEERRVHVGEVLDGEDAAGFMRKKKSEKKERQGPRLSC